MPARAAVDAATRPSVDARTKPSVVRPAIVYYVYFTAVGALTPYLAVYYRSIGLAVGAIGVLAALQAAVALAAAPAWGAVADELGAVRPPLVLAAAIGAAGAVLIAVARDPLAIAVGVVVLGAGASGVIPMLDARTVDLLGDHRDRYGRARAWGSIAFIVGALGVGALVDRTSPGGLFLVYVPAQLLTSVAGWLLLGGGSGRNARRLRIGLGDVGVLLRQGSLALFLFGSTLLWAAVTAVSTFFSVHLVALGAPAQVVGLAWAIGAVVEVPLMFAFPTLVRRIGSERLLVIAAVALAVRALGFGLTTNVAVLLAIQPLAGVGFALFYVGTVTYVSREAPTRLQATAQGIFSGTAFSVGSIVGATVGGQLGDALTLRGLFLACAVATGVAALVVARAVRGTGVAARRGR
ncbi:MAG: MFS transporter [Chloroflexota bacterium]